MASRRSIKCHGRGGAIRPRLLRRGLARRQALTDGMRNPIESAICYCESCRTAGRVFERDLGALQTVTSDGGVEYRLYRKDRVTIARGAVNLREYRLKPGSPTRRVVARCCHEEN